MKLLIVALITFFVLVPGGLIVALGLRRRFEKVVFGRIYVWDKPWVLVTQDAAVKRAYGHLQRRMIVLGAVLLFLFLGVVVFVP